MFTENPEIKGSESREAPKEQDHHSIEKFYFTNHRVLLYLILYGAYKPDTASSFGFGMGSPSLVLFQYQHATIADCLVSRLRKRVGPFASAHDQKEGEGRLLLYIDEFSTQVHCIGRETLNNRIDILVIAGHRLTL